MTIRRWGGGLLVLVLGILILWLTMDRELNMFDEGLVLTDALRAQAGELFHRDYYANYAPGSSYMVAAIFALTGPSFRAATLYGITVMAAIAAMLFVLVHDRVRWWLAAAGALAILLWMIGSPTYLYPSLPCALLALAATAILASPGGWERPLPLIVAGACSGVAAYFRYDTGFFITVAHCLAILIFGVFGQGVTPWRRMLLAWIWYGVGAGLVFLPGAIAFLAVASPRGFYADIIDYGLHVYPHTRNLPFPQAAMALRHPDQLGIYFPIAIVLIALPMVAAEVRAGTAAGRRMPLSLLLTVLTVILYYKGLVRAVPLHMILAIVPATALALLVVERWLRERGVGWLIAIGIIALTLVPPAYSAVSGMRLRTLAHMPLGQLLGRPPTGPQEGVSAACAPYPQLRGSWIKADYARAARFVVENSAPGEPIFVGVHDQGHIYTNLVGLHFATLRPPMTHWAQFDPGLQTRADVQALMVDELARARPRIVVRDASFDWVREPNDSAGNSGVHLVDAYLDAHYRPVAKSTLTEVWMRRDLAAPPLDRGPAECRMQPAGA